jgi:hypothetical protein
MRYSVSFLLIIGHVIFTGIMFLLQHVEDVLGGVFASWPTAIIRLLFVEEPTETAVRRVAASSTAAASPCMSPSISIFCATGNTPFP